jgi:hypothetical protein
MAVDHRIDGIDVVATLLTIVSDVVMVVVLLGRLGSIPAEYHTPQQR